MVDDDVAVCLTRLFAWWRRTAPKDSLGSTALSALDVLDRGGPLRLSDLAVSERLTQPGATAMVTRLVAAGLLRRQDDPRDGRVALIVITDAGRSHLQAAREQRSRALHAIIAGLPDAELATLRSCLPVLDKLTSTGEST